MCGCSWCAGRLPSSQSVVVMAREVLVPVSLGPLQKFKVVLHAALDEGFDGDGALDTMSGEGTL
jgi:hypothetical protein